MVRISNFELIKELMKNSRIKYTELAKRFNVSEAAIRKRIKQLENEEIIKSYTIVVDHKKLGFQIDTLIGIDTKPEDYVRVIEMLNNDENVLELYSTSGDHMIMIRMWFKNYNELSEYIKKLENDKRITRVCPATVVERLK